MPPIVFRVGRAAPPASDGNSSRGCAHDARVKGAGASGSGPPVTALATDDGEYHKITFRSLPPGGVGGTDPSSMVDGSGVAFVASVSPLWRPLPAFAHSAQGAPVRGWHSEWPGARARLGSWGGLRVSISFSSRHVARKPRPGVPRVRHSFKQLKSRRRLRANNGMLSACWWIDMPWTSTGRGLA